LLGVISVSTAGFFNQEKILKKSRHLKIRELKPEYRNNGEELKLQYSNICRVIFGQKMSKDQRFLVRPILFEIPEYTTRLRNHSKWSHFDQVGNDVTNFLHILGNLGTFGEFFFRQNFYKSRIKIYQKLPCF